MQEYKEFKHKLAQLSETVTTLAKTSTKPSVMAKQTHERAMFALYESLVGLKKKNAISSRLFASNEGRLDLLHENLNLIYSYTQNPLTKGKTMKNNSLKDFARSLFEGAEGFEKEVGHVDPAGDSEGGSAEHAHHVAGDAALAADIAAETAARIAGDTTNANAIAAETAARTLADSGLASDIAAEATRATGAEAGLASDITAETNRATAAEADLQKILRPLTVRSFKTKKDGYFYSTMLYKDQNTDSWVAYKNYYAQARHKEDRGIVCSARNRRKLHVGA